jgi:hypothetical protein
LTNKKLVTQAMLTLLIGVWTIVPLHRFMPLRRSVRWLRAGCLKQIQQSVGGQSS